MGKAFVTGGCGFIGSHIVDALLKKGEKVVIYDNLSTGRQEFIPRTFDVECFEGYLEDFSALDGAIKGCDTVYHLAANADVRGGQEHLGATDLRVNTQGTWNVLKAMIVNGVNRIAFASSAVVYGEPAQIPTPETYSGPQTSMYGATKLAAESIIQAFSAYRGISANIFRFVSLVGERYSHGVVFDFVRQLREHPDYLEILGDGTQSKSYLYIEDAVDGILHPTFRDGQVEIYNLGHDYTIPVSRVAKLVIETMGLEPVQLRYGGGKRGWIGDSPVVHLNTTKIRRLGWHSPVTVEEGIRRTVKWLMDHPWAFQRK